MSTIRPKDMIGIDIDKNRFKDWAKGKIKGDFNKYFKPGKLKIRKGKRGVSIPFPKIDLPKLRYGKNRGGVGQGPAQPGDDLGPIDKKPGDDKGREAGDQPGETTIDIDLSEQEVLEMLQAELPNMQPKGRERIPAESEKIRTFRRTGPESRRDNRRTMKAALKRQIAAGEIDPEKDETIKVVPIRPDFRYRSTRTTYEPVANAVLIRMRDVSGSVSFKEREIINYFAYCGEVWLRSAYPQLETVHIIHDTEAVEVKDLDEFLGADRGGGTKISSGLQKIWQIIQERYPPDDWNIYIEYFSDGLNWAGGDNELCIQLLQEKLLPVINQFGYGEIEIYRSSGLPFFDRMFTEKGTFGSALEDACGEDEHVVMAELTEEDDAFPAFVRFYGAPAEKEAA